MTMRDERNNGSVGKCHSPSTKRRRGRRHKSSSQSNCTHASTNYVSTESSSNQFVLRVRRGQRETRRYRHKSASSIEGCGRNLAVSWKKLDSSSKYMPTSRVRAANKEPDYSDHKRLESMKFFSRDKDPKRVNQKPPEADRFNDLKFRINDRYQCGNILMNTPLTTDQQQEIDQNFEEAKVSDILKSVIAREYKPIPARPSNPLRYKTELCRAHDEGGFCRFGMFCTFAHGLEELRAVPRHHKYKTELCRSYHSVGYCQYGARCHFVHDPEDGATLTQTTMPVLHPQQDSGSSVKNVSETICAKETLIEDDVLVAFHDLEDLEDKQGAFLEKEFDFGTVPELYLAPFNKVPSFMDYLLRSETDEAKAKTSESFAIKSDQYFESLDAFSENPDALFSSEWSSSRLRKPPFDESWWKDIPSLSKLNWPESDSGSAKTSTLSSLFPSLREKDTITNTPSLPYALLGEVTTNWTGPLDTRP